MILLIILGYLICSICAFLLFVWDWRHTFDLRGSDLGFFILMSLWGPISLIVACYFVLISKAFCYSKVILPRYKDTENDKT